MATFLLTGNAVYNVRILSGDGETPVRDQLVGQQAGLPGWLSVYWDGRDNAGKLVPGGTYRFSIEYMGGYTADVWRRASAVFSFTARYNSICR